MRRVEITCVALGAVLMVSAAAAVFWPAAMFLGGAMIAAAGWPRGQR